MHFAVAGCAAGSAHPLGTHLGAGFLASTLPHLEQEAYAEARLPRNAVAWLEALFDTKIVRLDRARSTRPFLFLALIHPSDPWPLPGHPEAMKMSYRQGYLHCENMGGD